MLSFKHILVLSFSHLLALFSSRNGTVLLPQKYKLCYASFHINLAQTSSGNGGYCFSLNLFDFLCFKDKYKVHRLDNCLGTNAGLRRIRKCPLYATQCAEIASNDPQFF